MISGGIIEHNVSDITEQKYYQAQFACDECFVLVPGDDILTGNWLGYVPGSAEGQLQATSHLRNEAAKAHAPRCLEAQNIGPIELSLVRLMVNGDFLPPKAVRDAEVDYRQALEAWVND